MDSSNRLAAASAIRNSAPAVDLYLAVGDDTAHAASTMKTILAAICGLPLALSGQTISEEMQARIDSAQRMEAIAKQEQERLKNLKPLPIGQIRENIAKREAEAQSEKEQEARHQYYVKLLKDSQTAPLPNKKQALPITPVKPVPAPRYTAKLDSEYFKSTSQLIKEERRRAEQARLELALTKEQMQKNFDDGCDQASALAESCSKMDPRPPILQVYHEGGKIIRKLCDEGKISWSQLVAFNKEFYSYVANIYNPPPPAPDPSIPPLPMVTTRTLEQSRQHTARAGDASHYATPVYSEDWEIEEMQRQSEENAWEIQQLQDEIRRTQDDARRMRDDLEWQLMQERQRWNRDCSGNHWHWNRRSWP